MHAKLKAALVAAAVAGLAAFGVVVDPGTLGTAVNALTAGCGASPETPAVNANAPDSGAN